MDVRERKMFRTTVRFLPCTSNGGETNGDPHRDREH